MTIWSAWSDLERVEQGWRFRVERDSEAADWYSIADADAEALARLLRVPGAAEFDAIAAAWDSWIVASPSLDLLREAGINPTPWGTWIPGGEDGYWYPASAAD